MKAVLISAAAQAAPFRVPVRVGALGATPRRGKNTGAHRH
jgi:hypothetical protein